jgi:hypothetical protein
MLCLCSLAKSKTSVVLVDVKWLRTLAACGHFIDHVGTEYSSVFVVAPKLKSAKTKQKIRWIQGDRVSHGPNRALRRVFGSKRDVVTWIE